MSFFNTPIISFPFKRFDLKSTAFDLKLFPKERLNAVIELPWISNHSMILQLTVRPIPMSMEGKTTAAPAKKSDKGWGELSSHLLLLYALFTIQIRKKTI